VVELIRIPVKLKPFLSDVAATIDLIDMGNEYPVDIPSTKRYKQRLSIIPVDESQIYGENYDGQFFRHQGSLYDVEVKHTIYKDDLRIDKHLWSFEILIPTLNGMTVVARFKGRLKRGRHTTVLKGQGMWKHYEGGQRGDLYVEATVK
jgi:DnaJ-class molecular chaperone